MGLLSEGSPLSWVETKALADHVRRHGIKQFIAQWPQMVNINRPKMKWGDEIEYSLIKFDDKKKNVQLSLRAEELLRIMQKEESVNPDIGSWKPEYASYMLEGTPSKPYDSELAFLITVEANMRKRREYAMTLLNPDEKLLSITTFPLIGCPKFTFPEYEPNQLSGASKSCFFPDEAIFNEHPRFRTLTRNIRQRRGEKVAIYLPIFKDKNTPKPFIDKVDYPEGAEAPPLKDDFVYMDAMGFGMGCSCLQVTFQCVDIQEATFFYDQLTPICPVALALSASAPFYRGYIVDTDARWSVIAGSVDDRTREERGIEPLKFNTYRIPKSRYDSVDMYLSRFGKSSNDVDVVINEEAYKELTDADVDEQIAKHLAHLFIRDPISVFSEKVNQNDDVEFDHFENIQSTNWQTMRFKPPPPGSDIGFRVEFRPLEVQLSDFENAAYSCFIVLLTRAILSFGLNFIIPMSKVEENMKTALQKDACRAKKFWFRTDVGDCVDVKSGEDFYRRPPSGCSLSKDENGGKTCCHIELMTINEIVNGKDGYAGLVPIIKNYMDTVDIPVNTHRTIANYLNLISMRASGELLTTAQWMRQFLNLHPSYMHDSVVPQDAAYDLLRMCSEITVNNNEKLFGNRFYTATTQRVEGYVIDGAQVSSKDKKLLKNSKSKTSVAPSDNVSAANSEKSVNST